MLLDFGSLFTLITFGNVPAHLEYQDKGCSKGLEELNRSASSVWNVLVGVKV